MATFFDGVTIGWWNRTDNYVYGKLTGNVSRSGNTVTLSSMTLTLTSRWTSTGYQDQWFKVNGTQTDFRVTASGTSLGSHSLNNTSFSVSTTQTSASVGWNSFDGEPGSFTVTFPSGASAPTGLSASNIRPKVTGFTANVSITGWGVGSGNRYRELQCWTYNASSLVEPRRYQPSYGNDLSGDITVDNTSSGTLNITGNTRYTLGVYASNGSAQTGSQRVGNYVTLSPALSSKSATTASTTSISVSATTAADGGYYAKNIQYSLNNSTWTTGATVAAGTTAATTKSFTISSLNANTSYTVYLRVKTTAGNTSSGSVSASTKAPAPTFSISSITSNSATLGYSLPSDGGANAKNLQYSLDNGSTWVTGATINTGSAKTGTFVITGLNPHTAYTVKTRVSTTAGTTNGNNVTFTTLHASKFYGSVASKSERIIKLYGSVNGKTKLVRKFYGPSSNHKSKIVYEV